MIGDLVTGDYEAEFNGIQFGGSSPYQWTGINLGATPDITTANRNRLRRHGMKPGDRYYTMRAFVLDVEVWGRTAQEYADNMAALMAALETQGEQPFVIQAPEIAGGHKIRANVRRTRDSQSISTQSAQGKVSKFSVQFEATDPRLYLNDVSAQATTLPSSVSGRTYDRTYPLDYGGVSTGGSIYATNIGNFVTPVIYRIAGPCVNPRIENLTTDEVMTFNITLADGESLIIDTDARTVQLDGVADRFYTKTSSNWIELEPGESEITFRASTLTTATMTMTYRSAWI